ncbi:hypothetical protein Cfast33896_21700 [Coprobacter fastidiosus]|nr:hypothetical protein Cfast33896_21700 [Coprobacter fastidiosus]
MSGIYNFLSKKLETIRFYTDHIREFFRVYIFVLLLNSANIINYYLSNSEQKERVFLILYLLYNAAFYIFVNKDKTNV